MQTHVGRALLSAAFDIVCIRFLLGKDRFGVLGKSKSTAADKSVRPTHYSAFRNRADSGGKVKFSEKGRPWVG
jgi:hypothetical protein